MTSATCVIQARTGSSRLPGKVLAEVAGRPMLRLMLDRLEPLRHRPYTTLVVATSLNESDDAVQEIAASAGVDVVRGSEHDVLSRYLDAVAAHPAEDIVRLTGDCPLMDPRLVEEVLTTHEQSGADYTSNTLVRTFPDGLDVEVVRAEALVSAAREATDPQEREHVTPFIYRRPDRFTIAQHTCPENAGDERWTIDLATDLEWLRRTVAQLPDPVLAPWRTILATIGRSAGSAS